MIKEMHVPLFTLIMFLSRAADLVSPLLSGHQQRVTYLALSIARQLGLSNEEQKQILEAGALHDIGAVSMAEKLATLQFEMQNPYAHAGRAIGFSKDLSLSLK